MLDSAPSSPWRLLWQRGLLLLALVAALYGAGLANGFTLDDHPYIENNERLRSAGGIAYLFFHPLEEGDTLRAHLYRPLAALAEALIGGAFGFTPRSFHLAGIGLYAGLCLLLHQLLRRLFSARLAWAGTLIFLVHPVHTEAVASAAGLPELLAAIFALAALERLIPPQDARSPGWGRLAAAGGFFLAALLCKETVLLLPLLAVLLYRQRGRGWPEVVRLLALLALPVAIYFAMRYQVIGSLLKSGQIEIALLDNPLAALSPLERAANGAVLLLRSLWLLIFPWKLSADYSLAALPIFGLAGGALAALAHLALIAAAWVCRRRAFAVLLGLGFFYLGLLPTANILFTSGTIFGERFLLLPALAVALPAALLFDRAGDRPQRRRTATVILAALLALFAARTVVRVGDWRDDRTLFESALRAYPESAKMNYNVAVLLQREGKNAAALPLAEKALAIHPGYGDARLLVARLLRGEGDAARAEALLRAGLAENPKHEDMWVELGDLHLGAPGGLARAGEAFRQGHEQLPASVKLAYNLAIVELEAGRPAAAEPLLEQVLGRVDWPDAYYALGSIQLGKRQYAAAALSFEKSLASPRWGSAARYQAALAQVLLGQDARALALLEQAEPGTETALLAAVALARVGDREQSRGILAEIGLADPRQCPPPPSPLGPLCVELLKNP